MDKRKDILDNININDVIAIVYKAGKAIMDIYHTDFDVEYKEDKSPLTEADKKSNEIICRELKKLYFNIPILSEENKEVSHNKRKNWEYYWCIDPIDGTKEFIKKNDEFTINIALIHNKTPILGVVYAPAIGELYYAKKGEGAFKEIINSKQQIVKKLKLPIQKDRNKIVVVASKSHLNKETEDFIAQLTTKKQHIDIKSKGSSLKLCMVAEGIADIYPRLAPTMEWDTAAADAIVREAGKMTYQYEKDIPLTYNKEVLLNPWFVVK